MTSRGNRERFRGGLVVLSIVVLVALMVAVLFGATEVDWGKLIAGDAIERAVVFGVRLPRVLVAAAVGAALAAAGSTFQTLLRNPLADPFILGVSGGAACAAVVATALGLGSIPGVIPLVSFGGACVAMFLVYALSLRHDAVDPARLLLAGLALNALFSALILLSLSIIRGGDLAMAVGWMMGSFSGATRLEAFLVIAATLAGMTILMWIASDLRLLVFGEEDARARGVDVEEVKRTAYLTASLITGAAVAAAGIIGFVGLLVPHLIRRLWGSDYRVSMPLSALGGAALLVLSDAFARTIVAPRELPIGALTALFGVPFFLLILRRSA